MQQAAHQSAIEIRRLHNTAAELRERIDRQMESEIATEELQKSHNMEVGTPRNQCEFTNASGPKSWR